RVGADLGGRLDDEVERHLGGGRARVPVDGEVDPVAPRRLGGRPARVLLRAQPRGESRDNDERAQGRELSVEHGDPLSDGHKVSLDLLGGRGGRGGRDPPGLAPRAGLWLNVGPLAEVRLSATAWSFFKQVNTQVVKASDACKLSEDVRTILGEPKNEIAVNFPVKLNDGKIHMFKGYRIQHNTLLGPFKGGIRYAPSVS